jgi:TPR repeat protein
LNGTDVQTDPAAAAQWLQRAADQGDAEAQALLGLQYEEGEGVAADLKKAMSLYELAAAQDYGPAQQMLAVKYLFGAEGVRADPPKAAKLMRSAASQGSSSAQYLLGEMYRTGNGVTKDFTQAAGWYSKAATQGDPEAQFRLALLYGTGAGVPKDDVRAIELYRQAAAQGLATAQEMVGFGYAVGDGVPADRVLAYAWLNLAASQGRAKAAEFRSSLERSMSSDEIGEAQRLSSSWKTGQVLDRRAETMSARAPSAAIGVPLAKKATGTAPVVNTTGHAGSDGLRLSTYSTEGHPKSAGLHITLKYPSDWQAQPGERPHVVQKFVSAGGRGPTMCALLVGALPAATSETDAESALDTEGLRDYVPRGATFLAAERTSLDGQPAGFVDYRMSQTQAGRPVTMYTRTYITFYDKRMIQLHCSIGDQPESATLEDAFSGYSKTLFPLVANGLVIHDKWKMEHER